MLVYPMLKSKYVVPRHVASALCLPPVWVQRSSLAAPYKQAVAATC
jgi:hypothetical protein